MDGPQLIATLLGAGGGGAVLLAVVNGLFKLASGASHRERLRNTNIAAQRAKAVLERDVAEEERDEADRKRREAEEHVSLLKRQLIENGLEPVERINKVNAGENNG